MRILFLMVLLCAAAGAQVDLPLSPATEFTSVGSIVSVELRTQAQASEEIAAIDVILSWDPGTLTFLDATDGHPWFFSGFLPEPDGINLDLQDGEALYTVLTSPSVPLQLPPDVLVATFRFQVIHTGKVSLTANSGDFGYTRVVSSTPGVNVTGDISGQSCFGIPGTWTDLGQGLAGTGGVVPHLTGTGAMACQDQTTITLTGGLPGAVAYYAIGLSYWGAAFEGGTIVPTLDIIVVLPVPANGIIQFGGPWPEGIPPGFSIYQQFWFEDPGAIFGYSASNGLKSTTG